MLWTNQSLVAPWRTTSLVPYLWWHSKEVHCTNGNLCYNIHNANRASLFLNGGTAMVWIPFNIFPTALSTQQRCLYTIYCFLFPITMHVPALHNDQVMCDIYTGSPVRHGNENTRMLTFVSYTINTLHNKIYFAIKILNTGFYFREALYGLIVKTKLNLYWTEYVRLAPHNTVLQIAAIQISFLILTKRGIKKWMPELKATSISDSLTL